MLTLYYKPTCRYCQRVLGEVDGSDISLDLKDISTDETLVSELIEKGGKQQVPYLIDSEKNVAMYESADIVDYLKENYIDQNGEQSFNGLKIHKNDEACDTCQ